MQACWFRWCKVDNFRPMKSPSIPIQIRYRDMDMNQHVNNAVYFTYMENARSAVLLEDMLKYHSEGFQFVVAEASCKYKMPIVLTDKIVCEVNFAPVRPTSWDIIYTFGNEETNVVHAEGTTRMVLFNSNTGRPMAIPEWFTNKYLI